jgi:hypothetical protein
MYSVVDYIMSEDDLVHKRWEWGVNRFGRYLICDFVEVIGGKFPDPMLPSGRGPQNTARDFTSLSAAFQKV